jgi:hypothetical protein
MSPKAGYIVTSFTDVGKPRMDRSSSRLATGKHFRLIVDFKEGS